MAFESIQSSLNPFEKYKNINSKKEFKLAQKLAKFQDNYWTAIPDKLLFDRSIEPRAKIVWQILQYLGDETGKSYYSQESLAFFYGGSTKTIGRYLQILIASNWLDKATGRGHPTDDCWVKWPPGCQNPKLTSAINKSKFRH
ncbi:helix-turn-helix domain-containing protein [Candidatus Parcubacteria bacterium]|nr:helix-turn-helix domain-containing protein [Candidatus Parcubacteria bacterium]